MTIMELDESQRVAAEASPETRQIVLAGPGSGKTEVVAALVAGLVVEHEVDPETELVVISFSRAAVRAVTRRLKDGDVSASAAVRTLDALAAQIVLESDAGDVATMSFDRRIEVATAALRRGDWGAIEDLRHLVVDEVQDVVALRAEFLLALVSSLQGRSGFTLLGDPAQAIYDFQLRSAEDLAGADLLRQASAAGAVRTVTLTGSYRALTRETRAAAGLRAGAGVELEDAYWRVREFVDDLVSVRDVDELTPLLQGASGSAAVLTFTNGEALLVAHELWDRDVPAVVRRPVRDPVCDPWVARVLASRSTWTREEFVLRHDDEDTARARWKALRAATRPRGATVDTSAVASALRGRRPLPGELAASDDRGPVVSTIHRAKGLEFDTVVLAPSPSRADDERDDHERTRQLYVGVTRARARLVRLMTRRVWGLTRDHNSDRWIRVGREKWRTLRFEMRGGDMDRSEPPGDDIGERTQEHLATEVHAGDALRLSLDPYRSTLETPLYEVEHDGVLVGRTSADFGRDLARRIGTADKRKPTTLPWPRLVGAHVEAVETVAGEPQRTRRDGVGRDGLWLGVRPVGLLTLRWSNEE